MSGWDIAGGLIATGLLVYLVAVLQRPEDFLASPRSRTAFVRPASLLKGSLRVRP